MDRVPIYLIIGLASIPCAISYIFGHFSGSFSILDGLTLFFVLCASYSVISMLSAGLMLISGLVIGLLSAVYLKVNQEYFLLYETYLTKDSLSLFPDLLLAAKNFVPMGYIVTMVVTGSATLITACWFGRNIRKPKAKLLLGISLTCLVAAIGHGSAHSTRYDTTDNAETWTELEFLYSFENPIMFFARSFLPGKHIERTENSFLNSIAAGIKNGSLKELPEEYAAVNFIDLMPEYPGHERIDDPINYVKYRNKQPSENSLQDSNQPNVLIIVLESVRAYEMNTEIDGTTLTPNLLKIAEEGAVFNNFYATNRVTVKSETAILCSLLDTQNYSPYSVSDGKIGARCLPKILGELGYKSIWIHGYTKDFFNRKKFMPSLGFSELFASEEFEASGYDNDSDIGWGVPDTVLFNKALDMLEKREEPFFAEILTLTNHQPFKWDYKDIQFPTALDYESNDVYDNYLKGIHYTDYALGKFWEAFSASSLKENTFVLITGDHSVPYYPESMVSESEQLDTLFKMPFIVLGPNIRHQKIDTRASHLDIAPTVLSIIEENPDISALGRPLLGQHSTDSDRPIFLLNMDNAGFLYGETTCLPTQDICSDSSDCVNYQNTYCIGTDSDVIPQAANIMKDYLTIVLKAGYPEF